jgi:hypothetical protein
MSDTQEKISNMIMDEVLTRKVLAYLENKPYKVAKPIVDSIKEGTLDGKKGYAINREMVLHFLDDILGQEEIVGMYNIMRRGYESLLAEEAKRARREALTRVEEITETTPDGSENGDGEIVNAEE